MRKLPSTSHAQVSFETLRLLTFPDARQLCQSSFAGQTLRLLSSEIELKGLILPLRGHLPADFQGNLKATLPLFRGQRKMHGRFFNKPSSLAFPP